MIIGNPLIAAGGGSATLQEKTNINPTTSSQTIVPDTGYDGLSSVQINAMPEGSATTPTTTITTNPTISWDSTNKKIKANYSGSESVTPTVSAGYVASGTAGTVNTTGTKSVTAESLDANLVASNVKDGVTIFNTTGTFTDSSTITGTGKSAATAANILTGKSAFLDGGQIDGTMANNGATGTTITSQGGTYTIPAGYTSGGTVTAQITATTLTNAIISGEAVEESTGDYAWKSTVNVPAGYHNAQTLEKTFSEIFPAPETPATADKMLSGYQAYNKSGVLMTGTMANNGETGGTIVTQGGTYTIPAGYTSGGTVTANINNGVITSGAGSASVSDPSYNSTSGKFDQTVSGTVAAPTVGTAGYVSSSAGTKNTNTVSGSKSLNKIVGSTSITGTTTKAPTLKRTAKPSADTWTDAASGAVTTTKPTSGPYVQIDADANTGTLTATPSVTTSGYGTSSYHGIAGNTATVGAAKATTAYVPITVGALSTSGSVSVSGSGNVSAGTNTISKNSNTNVSTGTVTTSKPSSGYYVAVDASTAAGSGSVSVSGTNSTGASATVSTAGYVTTAQNTTGSVTGSGSASVTVPAKAASTTYVPITTGALSASVSSNSGGSASMTATGFTAASSATSYYVTLSTSAGSVKAKASVGTAGYVSNQTAETSATSVSVSGNGNKVYIPAGSATTPATSKDQSTPSISVSSSGLITASVAATSVSVTPTVSAGYVASGTAGTVTMNASSNTKQLTTQAAKTVTPTKSSQTAVGSGVYTTGVITVGAIPSNYIDTSDANATAGDITSGKTAYVNGSKITGTMTTLLTTANTFTQVNNYSYASTISSSSTTSDGTINITNGGLVASSGIKGARVYGAVWNDLADLIPVDEECDLEYGKCYCFDGKHYYKSNEYMQDGIIGIHSDTAGFEMGHKDGVKELKCSVAGYVLAYVDKEYPVGTLLTCTEDGCLTEISKEDKINNPEKVIASYWKNEIAETWGDHERQILVNGRKWVKVR